jgi:hypothetical protein
MIFFICSSLLCEIYELSTNNKDENLNKYINTLIKLLFAIYYNIGTYNITMPF